MQNFLFYILTDSVLSSTFTYVWSLQNQCKVAVEVHKFRLT